MNRVGQPCKMCDKLLRPHAEKDKTYRNRGAGFCSPACWYSYHRMVTKEKKKTRTCRICGSNFTGNLKTCSAKCGYEFRKKFTNRKAPLTCIECGSMYYGQKKTSKYCSQACFRTYSFAIVTRKCEVCTREFKRTWGALKRVQVATCSRSCAAEARSGERAHNWRGGHDANRGPAWLKIAEQVRIRDGHKCRRCRKTQEENGEKLSVDHIMPWRLFVDHHEANQLTNLAALCRTCHAWKTSVAEKKMLKGDNISFLQYVRSLELE